MMKQVILLTLALIISVGSVFAKKQEVSQPTSYCYSRGVEEYTKENYKDAFDYFSKEVQDNPTNGYAYTYLAALSEQMQEPGQALAHYSEAIRLIPSKDKSWQNATLIARANLYKSIGDTVKAFADLDRAIKILPKDGSSYIQRGQLYFDKGDFANSNKDFERAIEVEPGNASSYAFLGRNMTAQGEYDRAIELFNTAERMAPDYVSTYSFRADSWLGKKNYDKATDDLIKALDLSLDAKAYFTVLDLQGESAKLMESKLRAYCNLKPKETKWPWILANFKERRGDYVAAINYYEKANAINPSASYLISICDSYTSLGHYDDALTNLTRAIAMEPDDPNHLMKKADLFIDMENYAEAMAIYNSLVEDYPDASTIYNSRALLNLIQGNYQNAIDDYTTVIVSDPNANYHRSMRARAYLFNGEKDLAESDLRYILDSEADTDANALRAFSYALLGYKEKTLSEIAKLDSLTTDTNESYYNIACLFSIIGEKEKALEYLRKNIARGERNYGQISHDVDFRPLKEDARFIELIDSLRPDESDALKNEILDMDANSGDKKVTEVPFTKQGGVTQVKCSINGLPLHFVFDTGAAEVTMSMVEANFMMKNDYIKPTDVIGSARYVDANGDISEGTVINLKTVDFGGLELENVRASVVRNQKAPLLLGQSVLGRLGKIEIDNEKQTIIITHIGE